MPWISLIGMFTHVLLSPGRANIGTCLFKFFAWRGLIHLTLQHLNR